MWPSYFFIKLWAINKYQKWNKHVKKYQNSQVWSRSQVFMTVWIFERNYKICIWKSCWRATLQQHFPYKSSKFSKIQTVVLTFSSIPGASNLAIPIFPSLAISLNYSPSNTWFCDHVIPVLKRTVVGDSDVLITWAEFIFRVWRWLPLKTCSHQWQLFLQFNPHLEEHTNYWCYSGFKPFTMIILQLLFMFSIYQFVIII